jgi:hypothetical protein
MKQWGVLVTKRRRERRERMKKNWVTKWWMESKI